MKAVTGIRGAASAPPPVNAAWGLPAAGPAGAGGLGSELCKVPPAWGPGRSDRTSVPRAEPHGSPGVADGRVWTELRLPPRPSHLHALCVTNGSNDHARPPAYADTGQTVSDPLAADARAWVTSGLPSPGTGRGCPPR